ncbi:pre-rRNA-processing protein ESF2 [Cryptomeria japonica]|uniref:pre-rRNA-processing protein ESF2 n=1 Tax=Cryptomeria japonica TaxID=3369 RepID=UPI0025AC0356|nr:pre-rRNA-processing protein ESF2 [Cryptomeria japonica]
MAEQAGLSVEEKEENISQGEKVNHIKNTEKRKRKKVSAEVEKRGGVCYLSRLPPHMKPLKLRQILSNYGEVLRIYLAPEDPVVRLRRRRAGGNRGKEFTEGWVEFSKKSVAKRVASMLNGEQIGGKRRSSHYYDLWNIKYLHKFKWDNLTEEIAYKNAVHEQKLTMELAAAKKERDFYLDKVEQSRAISSFEERLKKKQKRGAEGSDKAKDSKTNDLEPRVVRFFPQKKSISDAVTHSSPRLSKELLAGVFGGSSS